MQAYDKIRYNQHTTYRDRVWGSLGELGAASQHVSDPTGSNLPPCEAAQLDGKAGVIQCLYEEGGSLEHLGAPCFGADTCR